ncbi:kinase-like domain-containing protein [Melampsora americana]|nr:kinase-like domain-containing protein [Melampsora americana]
MLAVKRVNLMNGDSQLIPGSSAKHGHAVAALRSEIIMLKDLEHPNIVQYLGFEETAEFASIFLEYVPGGSIGGCIRAHGAFELQVTKSFTIQTVEGLKYLHHSGILHRDLKSDNILVDLKGICKIADFGISKVSSKLDAYQTNTCMSFKGTAFYMAPEIITNQKGYSAKADIWSLGCVVLEMMCGRRPWSEQNQFQALFKVGSEGVGPPIPGDLELDKFSRHFFRACFSRNPKDRPMADKLSHHLFLTLDSSWSFESSELFRYVSITFEVSI